MFRELLTSIAASGGVCSDWKRWGLTKPFSSWVDLAAAIQVQHELELLLGREVSMVELFDTHYPLNGCTFFRLESADRESEFRG